MITHPRLFDTLGEAITAPGMVYAHWKGGVYRLLSYIPAGQPLPDTLPLRAVDQLPKEGEPQDLVVYEHLWPHPHQYYVRTASEFFDHESREPASPLTMASRRFTPYEHGRPATVRLVGETDRYRTRARCGA